MVHDDTVCTVPPVLSRVARKREAFAGDPYFRDAWDDFRAVHGTRPEAQRLLHRVAPLVLRPDTMAARGGARVVNAVRALGFVPVAFRSFRFDRHITREVWRYQLNIATRERIDVMDMIMPSGPSLYVLFRHAGRSAMPACTRLSEAKGPSLPEGRRGHHLRRIAGPAQASVLTYVHVSDEPADILRELGVLFDRADRMALLAALPGAPDRTAEVLRALAGAEAEVPASDLAWRPALDRLEAQLDRRAAHGGPETADLPSAERPGAELRDLLAAVRAGRSRDWRRILDLADQTGLDWPHWDRVAVAAELSARHIDAVPLVPDVGRSLWAMDDTADPGVRTSNDRSRA